MWIKKTDFIERGEPGVITEEELMYEEGEVEKEIARQLYINKNFEDEIVVIDDISEDDIVIDIYDYVVPEFEELMECEDIFNHISEDQLYKTMTDSTYCIDMIEDCRREAEEEEFRSSPSNVVKSMIEGNHSQSIDFFIEYDHSFSDIADTCEYGKMSIEELANFADRVRNREIKG